MLPLPQVKHLKEDKMQGQARERRSIIRSGIIENACKKSISLYSYFKSDVCPIKSRGGPL